MKFGAAHSPDRRDASDCSCRFLTSSFSAWISDSTSAYVALSLSWQLPSATTTNGRIHAIRLDCLPSPFDLAGFAGLNSTTATVISTGRRRRRSLEASLLLQQKHEVTTRNMLRDLSKHGRQIGQRGYSDICGLASEGITP